MVRRLIGILWTAVDSILWLTLPWLPVALKPFSPTRWLTQSIRVLVRIATTAVQRIGIYVSTDGTCPHASTQAGHSQVHLTHICDSCVPAPQRQKHNNFEATHEEILPAINSGGLSIVHLLILSQDHKLINTYMLFQHPGSITCQI